jgi:hypothetical protein
MPLTPLNGIKKIGLIAGNGNFPLMFARAARQRGLEVIAIAVKKDTSRLLPALVKKTHWLTLNDFARMFEIFKEEEIKKVLMAGQVNPRSLFYKDVGDESLRALLNAVKDKRPDTIFGAMADMLAKHSIELIDSTLFLDEYLPKKGVLTRQKPDEKMWNDIRFGFQMAKKIAGLDIGQTLVVKNGSIVAVEAIEGTDAAIRRAGQVANKGIVVIKVSKPNQDMRFDIPVVGPQTIKYMRCVGARGLAIEARKTLMIEPKKCVEMADRSGIVIVSLEE